jgi:hypothetical protein
LVLLFSPRLLFPRTAHPDHPLWSHVPNSFQL